ncbi:MAG: Ig-like domain-containing protein [Anaerolineae bacterium]|nr:Ig-like domain-containing protein [Anaerolineae bacterium]
MKRTVPTWLALTLLMLLLVALATIFILLQTRQTLLDQRTEADSVIATAESVRVALDSTVEAQHSRLVEVEAQRDTLDSDLGALRAEVTLYAAERDALIDSEKQVQAALDSAEATVAILRTPVPTAPVINITAPQAGTEIESGTTVTITLLAGDLVGIAAVEILVNDARIDDWELEANPLVALETFWEAAPPGEYEIGAIVTNTQALQSATTVRVVVLPSDATEASQ